MSNKAKPEKKETKKTLVSYKDDIRIIDTIIYDWQPNFIHFERESKKIFFDETIEIWKDKFYPINKNSSFLTTWSLILPTEIIDYWDINTLIDEIKDFVYRYVDISPVFLDIMPYYVLLTYIFDNFFEIPYLRVIWDQWSGKSRFMKVIWNICYNSIITNWWSSVASLFRIIEKIKWTLVLDEADFPFSDTTSDIIKILNNWFQKWNPILRADWENFDIKAYDVFCPKIIWGRMEFRDKATESRCIIEIMKKTWRVDIPLNLSEGFSKESESIRNKLFKFRYDFIDKIQIKEERVNWLEWRLNQIINPILSIINFVWNKKDYENIISYFQTKQKEIKEDRKFTNEGLIFMIIKDKQDKWDKFIYYSKLLDDLKFRDDSILFNTRKLGSLLRQYDLRPIRRNEWFWLDLEQNIKTLNNIYHNFWLSDEKN